MFAGRSRLAARESKRILCIARSPAKTSTNRHSRLAFGERAGFVHDQRVDFGERFERFGVANEDADMRAAATATMTDIGVARPSAQGHAMISTATALTSACAKRGCGPNSIHAIECEHAQQRHRGHKIGGDLVGEALHRRAAALRFADQLYDLRQHRFAADALGLHDEAAAGVQRAAGDFIAGGFFDRHGSPVTIDSSTALAPSRIAPSTGTRSPGRTRKRSPRWT